MKQLTTYNRAAAYLNTIFDLLNARYFEGALSRPIITIQSTPKAYGHYTLYDAWSVDGDKGMREINIGAGTLSRPIENVVAGTNAGELNVNGHGELNLPILGDTAQVALDGFFTLARPNLYYENFHSKNLWWDQELKDETRLNLSGTLSYPKTKTSLFFGVENVTNYAYMKNTGLESVNRSNESFISHNVGIGQESSVQVMMARLQQRVDLKFFHIEADVAWQTSTKKEVLPLPTLSIYANAYFDFVLAKVLKVELGGNMKFFTKYDAPDYDPLTGQFILQNDLTKEKVGGYPLMSVYANLALKKLRFHLTYYHVNQSDGHYFTMPRYPMNPGGLRFGISWNFYD